MKEIAAAIIGVLFTIALITFTAMKMVPIEVFYSIALLAIGYFFKANEQTITTRIKAKLWKK
jgi:uncharacterized membrane protein